ncbi:MAG TPA: hypothetical protein VHO91_03080, partial [Rhodopila sp.]|nr:hypothetical protein [Rhodopila sp.]
SVSETAQNARDQAANAMNSAAGAVGSLGTSAQNAAQGAARYAGGALSSGGQMSSNMVAAISESPVLLGALGLAAGAMLGALIPQSEQEQAALGGIAGQTRDAATSLAREGIERGKHVAQAVADKAQESAQNHDLAGGRSAGQMVDAALSGELADNAKAALHDVLESGDKAIRKETASSGNKPSATGSSRPSNTP